MKTSTISDIEIDGVTFNVTVQWSDLQTGTPPGHNHRWEDDVPIPYGTVVRVVLPLGEDELDVTDSVMGDGTFIADHPRILSAVESAES